MKERLLAIDTDTTRVNKQHEAWARHGVHLVRASSMQEAMETAGKEQYVAIGINADTISYEPYLKILRDITDASIHVITSWYDKDKHINAFNLGANVFTIWCDDAETHVQRGLAQIYRHYENIGLHGNKAAIIGVDDLRIYPDYEIVTVRGEELELTPKEFQILLYLMANRGRVIRYERILDQIWGSDYGGSLRHVYDHVGRLCRKLEAVSREPYIECRKGVGYRFITPGDHK